MGMGRDGSGKDPSSIDGTGPDRRILPPGEARRRVQLGALLVGIAVATVALPSLVMRTDDGAPDPSPPPAALPATSGQPAVAGSPTPAPSTATGSPLPGAVAPTGRATSRPTAGATGSGTPRCVVTAAEGEVTPTAGVSCDVYEAGFGRGWQATGDGLKILPDYRIPDTDEDALRVERTRPGLPQATMTLVAARPVGIDGDDELRFRVWGGRDHGTVLRMSTGPAARGTVTFTAKADQWNSYSVPLRQLTGAATLHRIDLVVDIDEVPQVNRFYLDDIVIAG